MDGVPFVFNPAISIDQAITFDVSFYRNLYGFFRWTHFHSFHSFRFPLQVSQFNFAIKPSISSLEYNFNLERQILCATKTPNSTNPFFAG